MRNIRLQKNSKRNECVFGATASALLIAACSLLILSGCRSPLEPQDTTETGTLSLTVGRRGVERTIMPETTMDDFVSFHLRFIAQFDDYNTDFCINWTGGYDVVAGMVILDVGIWDLHVTAYLASGEAAEGSLLGIEIPSGETVAGDVRLYPIATGEGTFSWDISFPDNVARVEIVVTDLYGYGIPSVDAINFDVLAGEMEWVDYVELPAGRYRAIITLINNREERAVVSEVLHIYQNMGSNFTEKFVDCHFVATVSLADQLARLRRSAQSGGNYTIELFEDEYISPAETALPTSRTNLRITLKGIGGVRNVSLSANGVLFAIPLGVTLVLGENITLQGMASNTNHLVRVNNGGTLIMNEGSKIAENQNITSTAADGGGGVRVNNGGVFILDGGEILGNSTTNTGTWFDSPGHGGGVRIESGGRFDMKSGTISGNTGQLGGGVHVQAGGEFRISGGVIYGNEATVDEASRNTFRGINGASLSNVGTAQRGIFDPDSSFIPLGTLSITNNTIRLVDGIFKRIEGRLAEQLAWLWYFAQSGGEYIVEISDNETIAPVTAAVNQTLPTGRTNLTVILRGIGEMRNINLSANGSHFWIPSGVTLILDEYVILQGRINNTNHLVRVNNGGTLIMNEGSRIAENQNITSTAADGGGGVRVNNGGVFILDGGEILGNSTTNTGTWFDSPGHGGGVRIESGGMFDMKSGSIYGNEGHFGGGVHIMSGGTFRMGGGVIYGSDAETGITNISRGTGTNASASLSNAAPSARTAKFGTFYGNTFVKSGTLHTSSLTIRVISGVFQRPNKPSGNLIEQLAWLRDWAQSGERFIIDLTEDITSVQAGGLPSGRIDLTITFRGSGAIDNVSVDSGLTLVLDNNGTQRSLAVNNGGTIIMNAGSVSNGSGVNVNNGGVFIMNNGMISYNESFAAGSTGGVNVTGNGTIFVMHGGTISHNARVGGGGTGGVSVSSGAIFTMYYGKIHDNTASFIGASTVGGVSVGGDGTFTMYGGSIFNNSGHLAGGVSNIGTFNMHGGKIFGNRSYSPSFGGGGVAVAGLGGTFRISNGVIYGNEVEHGDRRNTADTSLSYSFSALYVHRPAPGVPGVGGTALRINNDGTNQWLLNSTNSTIRVQNGQLMP